MREAYTEYEEIISKLSTEFTKSFKWFFTIINFQLEHWTLNNQMISN